MTARATIRITIPDLEQDVLDQALENWRACGVMEDDLLTAIEQAGEIEPGSLPSVDLEINQHAEIDVSQVPPHELAKALDAEVRAMGEDYTGQWLRVRYEHCGVSWEDVWPCACDSECPVCGLDIEATSWEDA